MLRKRTARVRSNTGLISIALAIFTALSAVICLKANQIVPSDQEKRTAHGNSILESSPIKAPEKYIKLEKVRSIPESSKKKPFGNVLRIGALSDYSIAVLDNKNGEVIRLSLDGEELARWGGRGTGEGQFLLPWELEVAPDNTIYVIDSRLRVVRIFEPDGKLVDSFKNLEGMREFRFSPSGNIYNVPYWKTKQEDGGAFVLVFDRLGMLESRFGTVDSIEFPELNWSQFFAPLVGEKEIVLMSKQFPIFQVYSTSGVLQAEVLIDDPRFSKRRKANIEPVQDDRGGRIPSVPAFKEVQWLDGDLLISVMLESSGVEFLLVNTLGEVTCSYYYQSNNQKDAYKIIDFVVINSKQGLFFVGVTAEPWPQVVIFSPVEELPQPN